MGLLLAFPVCGNELKCFWCLGFELFPLPPPALRIEMPESSEKVISLKARLARVAFLCSSVRKGVQNGLSTRPTSDVR